MIIATYVKFGNDRHYFQTNNDLFKKIKSFLFNQFQKDVDFLIDLLATKEEHLINYENYLEEKELDKTCHDNFIVNTMTSSV